MNLFAEDGIVDTIKDKIITLFSNGSRIFSYSRSCYADKGGRSIGQMISFPRKEMWYIGSRHWSHSRGFWDIAARTYN